MSTSIKKTLTFPASVYLFSTLKLSKKIFYCCILVLCLFCSSVVDSFCQDKMAVKRRFLVLDLVEEPPSQDFAYLSHAFADQIKNAIVRDYYLIFVTQKEITEQVNEKDIDPITFKNDDVALGLGRSTKADNVIFGTYSVKNNQITVKLNLIDVEKRTIIRQYEKTDDLGLEMFKIADDYSEKIEPEMKASLRPKETAKPAAKAKVPDSKSFFSLQGYPFMFGYNKNINTESPYFYFGLAFRHNLLNSQTLFLEYELGFLHYSYNTPYGLTFNKAHGFPLTVSLAWEIWLSDIFCFYPKIGLGWLFVYLDANNTKTMVNKKGLGNLLIIKPSLAFRFKLSQSLTLVIETNFIIGQDVQAKWGDLDYFLIPSFGFSYGF